MSIVIRDGERLYLGSWEYNAARIISKLAEIVENNGGRVKPTHYAIISNRTLEEAKQEYKTRIEKANAAIAKHGDNNDICKKAIATWQEKIDEYNRINNDPIRVTHTTYISFVLDGIYYYYQVDSNPLFDFYFRKTPVVNGKASRDAAGENASKEWLLDCYWYSGCNDAKIKEAAYLIFNELVSARNSKIIRDSKRVRVSNTYNSGYHYETVYERERFENIDF